MNLPAQGLHSTCPQGIVIVAFTVLERFLSQAGQIKVEGAEDEGDFLVDLKLMVTSDFREMLCLLVGEEAGQSG